jgi:N-acetylneuraminate synthase
MIIADRDTTESCYLIAEASLGHKGNLNLAKQIVTMAANADADAIKFQMFHPSEPLFCPWEGDEARWPKWKASAMPKEGWLEVAQHCKETGIHFLASVFQPTTVEWLKVIDPPAWKVASRAADSFPYDEVSGPFLLSGGATQAWYPDIRKAVGVLQCKMEYPHPPYRWDENNYDGLSDHSGEVWPGVYAMAHGCEVLEVHVSFDEKERKGEELTLFEFAILAEARTKFAALRASPG